MSQPSLHGLTSEDAARLLAQFGPNAPPESPPPGVLKIALRTLKEPMFFLLAAAATLYLFVGDLGEGLFMMAGAGASISLVVFQELRSERALQALQRLAEPTAHVRRDGEERRIPARDLVPGDIILIGEGQRVSADALLLAGDALVDRRVDPDRRVGACDQNARRRRAGSRLPGPRRRLHAFPLRRLHDRARLGRGAGRAHRPAHGGRRARRLARRHSGRTEPPATAHRRAGRRSSASSRCCSARW